MFFCMSQKTSEPHQNDKIVCSDPPYDSPLVSFDALRSATRGSVQLAAVNLVS